jgi:hypothetical protein
MKTKYMGLGAFALSLSFFASAQAPAHKLTKLWETAPSLKVPESVRFDAKRKVLYVSNIDGEPWAVDGKGSIAKVGLDGKVIAAEWITGLDCPKGLALSDDGKTLYAADAGGIQVIDIETAKITSKIKIPQGQQLNDLVNDRGTLFVSDSKGKKVFMVMDGKATVYLDQKVLKGPNGLFVQRGTLFVLDNDSLSRVEKDKKLKVIASGMEGGVDGLENVTRDDFLVSAVGGAVWYVRGDGSKELLFDGKAVKTGTADLGFDFMNKIVYVPTFNRNTVIAFQVE